MVSCHRQTVTTSSFPTWIPFISISFLIAVMKTSKAILGKSDYSGHLCFVPDLEECFQLFITEYDVKCTFTIYGFHMLRNEPSVFTFCRVFIINEC